MDLCEFAVSLGYIEKPCLEEPKQANKSKWKELEHRFISYSFHYESSVSSIMDRSTCTPAPQTERRHGLLRGFGDLRLIYTSVAEYVLIVDKALSSTPQQNS